MAPTPFATTFTLPPVGEPGPAELATALCPGDLPLLLLPVRLETRFFAQPGGDWELRVRIYPDAIHIDSHERQLTATEAQWGQHFWEQAWAAGQGTRGEQDAWRQLADRFGDRRAAFIANLLRPANAAARPAGPIDPSQPPTSPPHFPHLEVAADTDGAWRHAPHARLLPQHWTAVVRSDGKAVAVVTGRDIATPLAVGPDPTLPAAVVPDGETGLDLAMAWMVDFDAAEAAGMGLRVPLSAAVVDTGIDGIYVLGAGTDGPTDTAAAVGELLAAHHYTDGLGFVDLATPSNNSTAGRAGGDPNDRGHQASYAAEVAADPTVLAADSNALRLGTALGLPTDQASELFGRLAGSAASSERDQRSIGTALWEAGWGYFLSNQIGYDTTGLTADAAEWARGHLVGAVRAGGPFAAIRCGKQPYGILPTTSLDLWQPAAGAAALDPSAQAWLRDLLIRLRDRVWRPQLGQVARIGRRQQPPDPDADLAEVMRTDGVTAGYRARSILGRHYLEHLRAFFGENLRTIGFLAAEDAMVSDATALLELTAPPRAARGTFAELAWPIRAPIVVDGDAVAPRISDTAFVAALLGQSSIAGVLALSPGSLLQALLRHAMLREYAAAAASITGGAAALRESELVDLVEGAPPSSTWQRQLDQTVPAVTGTATVREFLQTAQTFDSPHLLWLGAFRDSLRHLATLDVDTLRVLTASALDVGTDRLDAWITSLATRRLADLRAANPEGVYVGGFGWLENLAPRPNPPQPVTPPPGEQGPLFAGDRDTGFIHAPSPSHAAAAALLRNAHLGATDTPDANSPFSITLTSRGIRDADRLLDGVRQGQPLGALLGYRFERALHDAQPPLDVFIAPLRALAPLNAGRLVPSGAPVENIAAANVADGLALQRLWHDRADTVRAWLRQAGATPTQLSVVAAQLDDLGAAIDALGDALTAEAAYQAVRGNTIRTAATLSSIAHGDAPPPELEVARIPRSGTAITHRVLTLLPAVPAAAPGWTADSPRAQAEPALNGWAGSLLGDPRHTRCTVQQVGGDGQVVATRAFTLAELGLAPLDIVYAAEVTTGDISPVEEAVLGHLADALTAGVSLRLQHERPADLESGELTLFDVLEQARGAFALFAGARGADADDLAPPERAPAPGVDLTELEARVVAAEQALATAQGTLDRLAGQSNPDPAALREALSSLRDFGVPGTSPVPAADLATLLVQVASALKESRARLDTTAGPPTATDDKARLDQLCTRMRSVFGDAFLVLPRFTCEAGPAEELGTATAAGAAQGADRIALSTWMTRVQRARPPTGRLAQVLTGAELLETGDRLNMSVAQLPYADGERWVGLPCEAGQQIPPGKLSLQLQLPVSVDMTQPMTGVVVDEWVEVVPSRSQDTTLTFQLDPPAAFAPQSLLLAVPPVPGQAWTLGTLHRVLLESLDLAKLRGVRCDALDAVGQYLPAVVLAFNDQDDAVSTDFDPLTRFG